jgi:hypothetical protein
MSLPNSQISTGPLFRNNPSQSSSTHPKVNKNRITGLFFTVILLLISLQACQDNNIVGSGSFIPNDRIITVDTLPIGGFTPIDLKTFTGNLPFFSAGKYHDPLFGTMEATAFLATGLGPVSSDTLLPGAEMYIVFRGHNVYGDTLNSAQFSVHQVTQRWRPNATNAESEYPYDPNPLATFFISNDIDSVMVKLPQEWADRYRDDFYYYAGDNRTENLLNNEFGFAIVPITDHSIIGFRTATDVFGDTLRPGVPTGLIGTRLMAINPVDNDALFDDDDTPPDYPVRVDLPFRGWGFNFSRTNIPDNQNNTAPFLNTFQNALKLDIDLDNSIIRQQAISRVELVLFEDTDALNNLPDNHNRPKSNRMPIYRLEDVDLDFLITTPFAFDPLRTTSDRSFRITLTEFFKTLQLVDEVPGNFYLLSGSNNGLILPNALTIPNNPERAPKLIITSVKPEVN